MNEPRSPLEPDRPYTDEDEREEAEAAAALPDDPEIETISQYMLGQLSPEEASRVEARLATDPDYRAYAQPLLQVRDVRPPAIGVLRREVDLEASWQHAWQRLKREVGAAPATAPAVDREPAARPKPRAGGPLGVPRREVLWRRAIFATILVSLLVPESIKLVMRLATAVMAPAKIVVVDKANGRVVTVTEGVVAALSQGARLMYRDKAGPEGTWELYLDGSARFTIEGVENRHFVVITPSARVLTDAGSFAVFASDPGMTRVQLDVGHMLVESRGTASPARFGLDKPGTVVAPFAQAPRLQP